MEHRCSQWLLVVVALLLIGADDKIEVLSEKQALSRLQDYVGDWRGVGQPRRGSPRGAWREQCGWVWNFKDAQVALKFKVDDAKFFHDGTLRWLPDSAEYELTAQGADSEKKIKYVGKLEAGKLVLDAKSPPMDKPARISIRQVAGGDRMLVLFQSLSAGGRFVRLAEVGYTREGSDFGKGTNQVECVVTGGLGTIAVKYEEKTYYVCCSGCRDLFNDDPEGVLADYREEKAKQRVDKKKQQLDPDN